RTLTDGGQRAPDVAQMVAAFIEPARETLELALYDVRLHDDTAEVVRGAIVGAHERGVHVRLLYNVEPPDRHPPIPPPPKTDPSLIESLPFETVGIPGWPDLMHHKYVVRDRDAVWSGSTNWTDEAWSTRRRSTRCSISGARTGTLRGRRRRSVSSCSAGTSPASIRRPMPPAPCTITCTPRSSSVTTSSSSAASISPTPASRTRRTCWRSTMRGWPNEWRPTSTRYARGTVRWILPSSGRRRPASDLVGFRRSLAVDEKSQFRYLEGQSPLVRGQRSASRLVVKKSPFC